MSQIWCIQIINILKERFREKKHWNRDEIYKLSQELDIDEYLAAKWIKTQKRLAKKRENKEATRARRRRRIIQKRLDKKMENLSII